MSKHYVEEFFVLDITSVKKDLKKIRNGKVTEGVTTIYREVKKIQLSYWSEFKDKKAYLVVAAQNQEPQAVPLALQQITYGLKTYFVCECGKRCSKLFCHPQILYMFKCAKCHNLRYKLSSIYRQGRIGMQMYMLEQFNKFIDNGKKCPRIFYNGKETKPFIAYRKKMARIGMFQYVEEGQKQIAEIQNISKKISILSEYLHEGSFEGA